MLSSKSSSTPELNQDKLNSFPRLSWLSHAFSIFVHYFFQGSGPRIWQKRNSAGEVFYRVYDPKTGRAAYLTSDTDLRAWLDKLPYQ
jgi:hypothetical protein